MIPILVPQLIENPTLRHPSPRCARLEVEASTSTEAIAGEEELLLEAVPHETDSRP